MAKPENPGGGRAAEAHAARDERKAAEVWDFPGDGTNPAGQVNIVGKQPQGSVLVRPVGGGTEFTVKRDMLTKVGGEDDGAEETAPPA